MKFNWQQNSRRCKVINGFDFE